MQRFIKINKELWSDFTFRQNGKKILFEEDNLAPISHANAVFSIILNQAEGLTPVWLTAGEGNLTYFKSYVPCAQMTSLPKRGFFPKIRMLFVSAYKFIGLWRRQNILSFSYDGVKYGDILYDTYLTKYKLGTIKRINLKLIPIIYSCICRHQDILKILRSDDFQAVLVSHQIGVYPGVMLRVALRYGYDGYLRAGHHQSTLQRFKEVDQVYDYEYKPFPSDIESMLRLEKSALEIKYNAVREKQTAGAGDKDGLYAYSAMNKFYADRDSFMADYQLDPKKKNVFIMMHALNDYPHSHFRWMIFKDFYDWLLQTLDFAKEYSEVNWIFKQHPSIRFYPVKDVDFAGIFSGCQKHIRYISEATQIDTRSLVYCTDLVITCLGSAGFELPAMGGIPSLTAGETFYSGLGFTHEPRSREEYFEKLKSLPQILKPLTPDQQLRSKAAYVYIYDLSRVDLACCPVLSLEQEKASNLNQWYWTEVMKLYGRHRTLLKGQIKEYIRCVSEPGFMRLSKPVKDLLCVSS